MQNIGRRAALFSGGCALLFAAEGQAQDRSRRSPAAMIADANSGTIGIISGGVDGTYIRIAADLSSVLDDGDYLRVLPIIGKGSMQNVADLLYLRGVDVAIVQSDVLAAVTNARLYPGVGRLIQYVTKLYDEEVHLIARKDIKSIEDLAGKAVNVDVRGSGTAMTASVIFRSLGIEVQAQNTPQDVALARLRRGEIAAAVYVAGKPARLFSSVTREDGLHLLPLPLTPALLETYLPATFEAGDYPALVAEEPVQTVAVGAVLAVYAWQPGTERHAKLLRFVERFTSKFPELLQPPRHPKWREVNLNAQVPGWTKFTPIAATAPQRPR